MNQRALGLFVLIAAGGCGTSTGGGQGNLPRDGESVDASFGPDASSWEQEAAIPNDASGLVDARPEDASDAGGDTASLWAWTEVPLERASLETQLFHGGFLGLMRFSAIYDEKFARVVVYGGMLAGEGGEGDVSNAVLALDPETGSWTRLDRGEPHGQGAGPRYEHTAVYDPDRQQMVVFGGRTAFFYEGQPSPSGQGTANTGNIPNSDVWAFDLTAANEGTWRALDLPTNPGKLGVDRPRYREGHSAIYDPKGQRMVVFGGANPLAMEPDAFARVQYNDVWSYDLVRNQWNATVLPSSQGVKKVAGHTAVYDSGNHQMVVFSGWAEQFRHEGGDNIAMDLSSGSLTSEWTGHGWSSSMNAGHDAPPSLLADSSGAELVTPVMDLSSASTGVHLHVWFMTPDHSRSGFVDVSVSTDGGSTWGYPVHELVPAVHADGSWAHGELRFYPSLLSKTTAFKFTRRDLSDVPIYLDDIRVDATATGRWIGDYVQDVIALDLASNTFHQWRPASTPVVRYGDTEVGFGREGHTAVYDPKSRRMLMLGGTFGMTAFGHSDIPQAFYALDLSTASGGDWQQLPVPQAWTDVAGHRFEHGSVMTGHGMLSIFGMDRYAQGQQVTTVLYQDAWRYGER